MLDQRKLASEKYECMEMEILACLLMKPSLISYLQVEEKHFSKYGYILKFFKEFYDRYKTLDVGVMYDMVKGTSLASVIMTIENIANTFVIPNHIKVYEKRLIDCYKENKKEKWIKEKIADYTNKLLIGSISIYKYKNEINKLYENVEKIEWR